MRLHFELPTNQLWNLNIIVFRQDSLKRYLSSKRHTEIPKQHFFYIFLQFYAFRYFYFTFLYFSSLNLQTFQSLNQKSNLERPVQKMPQTTKSRSSITRTIPHKSTQICTQPATDSSLKSKKQPKTAPSNGNTTVDVLPQRLQTKIRDRAVKSKRI